MTIAREAGVDLVEVSPNERPPVCKIMDYGKQKYLQSKRQKQKHHEQRLKEIRIRPKTDPHDREIKLNRARRFLGQGDRVQFTMMFRGRERFHKEVGLAIFDGIVTELGDLAKLERPARAMGRRMTMVMVPSKPAGTSKAEVAKKPKRAKAEQKTESGGEIGGPPGGVPVEAPRPAESVADAPSAPSEVAPAGGPPAT